MAGNGEITERRRRAGEIHFRNHTLVCVPTVARREPLSQPLRSVGRAPRWKECKPPDLNNGASQLGL